MGGTIAQLIARDHPRRRSAGIVLSGTAQHFQDPETAAALEVDGRVRPAARRWRRGRPGGPAFAGRAFRLTAQTAWWLAEMTRHGARDVAEAGRELGRFDSRPWLRLGGVPAAIVITTARSSGPAAQAARARRGAIGATVFEVRSTTSRSPPGPTSTTRRCCRRCRGGRRALSGVETAASADQIRFPSIMRRARFMLALTVFAGTLLTFAPAALAAATTAARAGTARPTTRRSPARCSSSIAFFPVVILVFSLIQWRLDKRKHARMDAAKAPGRPTPTGAAAGSQAPMTLLRHGGDRVHRAPPGRSACWPGRRTARR